MPDQTVGPAQRELPATDDLQSPPTFWTPPGRQIFKALVRLRQLTITVHNAANVPETGPVILASNHMGVADGPVLWGTARRPVHALTKIEMFHGIKGQVLLAMGQIPIDRAVADPRPLRMTLRVLRDGGCAIVFPEGGRGIGAVERTRGGAAYFALATGAPVVPVVCLGTRADGADISEFPPKGSRIDIVYGEAMSWPAERWPRTKGRVGEVREIIQKALHDQVLEACRLTGQTLPAMASGR
jgi:1-acyl-sn-glycerol-3-phosphate acyltransferase